MAPIPIYSEKDFVKLRAAGRLAAQTLDMITSHVVVGVTTEHLDNLMHDFIVKNGGIPAPLGYHGYPKATCISHNHVVCHGIPSKKKLMNGDIVNIDVTVILDGWYGDTSRMYYVGDVKTKARKLVETTFDCMWKAIELVKPGARLGDIGAVIQEHAEDLRYGVVRDFCGHGIGDVFHQDPQVLHYGKYGTGIELKEGMVFTIEPMINEGTHKTKVLSDDWTAITQDRKLSAQFEHTLAVTKDGFEIFTASPKGLDKPPYNI